MRAELKQRLDQIEGYAKTLAQSIRIMDERRHILEPLLQDDEVRTALNHKFKNTYGAYAYNHLVPLLGQDLLRDLARLFLDEGARSGSLINLHRKVKDKTLHAALRTKFGKNHDDMYEGSDLIPGFSAADSAKMITQWRDQHRKESEASFDRDWIAVSGAVATLAADPIAAKIKTFRDKYHAHLEMTPLGEDPGPFDVKTLELTYSDIMEFADRHMSTAYELVRLLTGHVYAVQTFSSAHQNYGVDMWRILAGLPSISISSKKEA